MQTQLDEEEKMLRNIKDYQDILSNKDQLKAAKLTRRQDLERNYAKRRATFEENILGE